MAGDVSGGRERLGAVIDRTRKGFDAVSSNVSCKVMCPSAGRAANVTDMSPLVGTFMTTRLDISYDILMTMCLTHVSLLSLQSGAPVGLGLLLQDHLSSQPKVLFCPGCDQPTDAATAAAAKTPAPTPTATAGPKSVRVAVTYDEAGRVTQASVAGTTPGAEAYGSTAVRIARGKHFPAGKPGTTVVTIPVN